MKTRKIKKAIQIIELMQKQGLNIDLFDKNVNISIVDGVLVFDKDKCFVSAKNEPEYYYLKPNVDHFQKGDEYQNLFTKEWIIIADLLLGNLMDSDKNTVVRRKIISAKESNELTFENVSQIAENKGFELYRINDSSGPYFKILYHNVTLDVFYTLQAVFDYLKNGNQDNKQINYVSEIKEICSVFLSESELQNLLNGVQIDSYIERRKNGESFNSSSIIINFIYWNDPNSELGCVYWNEIYERIENVEDSKLSTKEIQNYALELGYKLGYNGKNYILSKANYELDYNTLKEVKEYLDQRCKGL